MADYTSVLENGAAVDAELIKVRDSNLNPAHKITRSATLVIAASDSSAKSKAQADYVCDGTNDEVEIRAAVAALPAVGTRTVKLLGSFVKGDVDPIVLTTGTNIELDGSVSFAAVADGAIMFSATDASKISIIGGTLDGKGDIQAAGYRTLIQLTNVSGSIIDTYMTNVGVKTNTEPATVNGAYVKEIGVCYGNSIINRKYPKTLTLEGRSQTLNSEQLLISNCDAGWTLGENVTYDESVYLSAGKSLKLPYNSGRTEFALPAAIDFTKATLHALIRMDKSALEIGGNVVLKCTFMTDSITNRVGDECRFVSDGIKDRWLHVVYHPGQPSAWYDTSGAFEGNRVTKIAFQFTAASGNVYIDRVWYTHSTQSVISFSFDDCFTEAMTAYGTVLNKYGLKGVWGVNPNNIGTAGKMTLADLKTYQSLGHEIINHGWSHCSSAYNTQAVCEDEGFGGQDYLISQGFVDGSRFYMLPYTGRLSTEGYDALKKHMYFASTYPRINPLPELPSPYIARYTTNDLAKWQTAVDQCVQRGGWLIFYCHSPTMDSLSSAVFEQMVQYVISKKLRIATFSEVIDNYAKVQISTTEKTGTATIPVSAETVTITHGLSAAPSRVLVSPTTPTAGKSYHVSAKTATTFTITIDSAAEADISFDWQATL